MCVLRRALSRGSRMKLKVLLWTGRHGQGQKERGADHCLQRREWAACQGKRAAGGVIRPSSWSLHKGAWPF